MTDAPPSEEGDVPGQPGPGAVLDEADLRRRAAGGAASLGARSALVLALAVGGNIVLARLLDPRDFGLVALGATLLLAGNYVASGGLGFALVGRPQAPTRRELEAITGVQLAISCAVVAVCTAAAIPFGMDGLVPAIMVAAVPIVALRVPQQIMLERELAFRTIALVDVVEVVVQYTWAIATVAAGAGVWGFASAAIVRSVAATATMVRLGSVGLVRPRRGWREVRPLFGFGVRYQGVALVDVFRDQTLNFGITAIAGVAVLGVWSLAFRVLQIPLAVLSNLIRVSYPAMSKLLAAGGDPKAAMDRTAALTAAALAVAAVAIVGGAPALVPAVLGDRWSDVSAIVAPFAAGLVLSGPVSAAAVGWLYARGEAGTVLRSSAAGAAVLLVTALSLLPVIGVVAVGIGWLAGSVTSGVVLALAAHRESGVRLGRALAVPSLLGLAGGGLGWALATAGSGVALGLASLALAEAVLLGGLWLLVPDVLRSGRALVAQGFDEARPRRRPA